MLLYIIRNVNIERVRVVKFLGVNVDDLLNWIYRITYVKSKLSRSVGIMCVICLTGIVCIFYIVHCFCHI